MAVRRVLRSRSTHFLEIHGLDGLQLSRSQSLLVGEIVFARIEQLGDAFFEIGLRL